MSLVVTVGVVSRGLPLGFSLWDKYLGDVLYASLFYFAFSLLWSRNSIAFKATLTCVYVAAIEFFQLTGIPAQLNQSDNLLVKLFAYFVLGSGFSGWDLLAYGIGILLAVLVDRVLLTKIDP